MRRKSTASSAAFRAPLFVFALSFVASLAAPSAGAACPALEGEYWCMTGPETLDLLAITRTERAGVTEYTIGYSTVGGEPETIRADARGIPDGDGWITKCTRDRHVLSVRDDGSALGDIYLDEQDAYVREYNERVVQRCPRRQGYRR